MARPSETAQVDIGPDEIVKSNSCSNGSYMIDVSLSDLPLRIHKYDGRDCAFNYLINRSSIVL